MNAFLAILEMIGILSGVYVLGYPIAYLADKLAPIGLWVERKRIEWDAAHRN